jgi:hypothetical protein
VTARSIERADTAPDHVQRKSKAQKDKADSWPTLREAGKESSQPIPPGHKDMPETGYPYLPRSGPPERVLFLCHLQNLRMPGSVGGAKDV